VALLNPRAFVCASLGFFWWLGAKGRPLELPEREKSLRSLLRRFPYWLEGHRELALLSLKRDNVALAYSSAVIYEMLCRDIPKYRREGLLILGQCFLKRGDSHRAIRYFEEARSLGLTTPQLAEEIAAAHILRGSYQEALDSLLLIPSQSLSPEGKAALSFVRSKQLKAVD